MRFSGNTQARIREGRPGPFLFTTDKQRERLYSIMWESGQDSKDNPH